MKRLAKSDLVRRDEYINQLQAARDEMTKKSSELVLAIEAYNEAVARAQGWLEDLQSTGEAYRDERSEKWHESEAAEAYENWLEALGPDTLSEEDPEELPDCEGEDLNIEALNNLPLSPEET